MKTSDRIGIFATAAVLFVVVFCLVGRLCADEIVADYVEGEKSAELITPEVETAASTMMGPANARAFLHALRLSMRKYDIDMRSQAGRRAWHGQFLREEIHTNDLAKVEVYSNTVDGTIWRYKSRFQPKPMVNGIKRKTTFATNGLPARLVSIRAKRATEIDQGTVVTNVETIANAPAETSDEPPPASH